MQVVSFHCVFISSGALFGDDVKKFVSGLIIMGIPSMIGGVGFFGGAWKWFQQSYIIVMPCLLLRSWQIFRLWTTTIIFMWNIILIQHGSKELAGHRFWLYVDCDIELGNMTLTTNHDIPFGHGHYMWKILSISNMVPFLLKHTLEMEFDPG